MTFSGGCSGAPGRIWANESLRADALQKIADEVPDNVVLGYFRGVGSNYEDYQRWVDATVAVAPEARIYLVLPWLRAPFGAEPGGTDCDVPNPGSDPWVDRTNGRRDDIFNEVLLPPFKEQILTPLRTNYPDTDFVLIPQSLVAQRLLQVRADTGIDFAVGTDDQHQLSINGEGLTGSQRRADNVIFTDQTAHAGSSLRIAVATTYLAFIYGTEVREFSIQDKSSFGANPGIRPTPVRVGYTYYSGFDFVGEASVLFNTHGTVSGP